jgi:hypothetical protein
LLERGIKFEKKRLFSVGKGLQVQLFSGKEQMLAGMRVGVVRIVVFPTEEERDRFELGLGGGEKTDAAICIARDNGALAFAFAARNELEPLIPG